MPTLLTPRSPLGAAVQELAEPPSLIAPGVEGIRSRQCGRCRLVFEGDPSAYPTALPGWWLCPPCRTILLGDR